MFGIQMLNVYSLITISEEAENIWRKCALMQQKSPGALELGAFQFCGMSFNHSSTKLLQQSEPNSACLSYTENKT